CEVGAEDGGGRPQVALREPLQARELQRRDLLARHGLHLGAVEAVVVHASLHQRDTGGWPSVVRCPLSVPRHPDGQRTTENGRRRVWVAKAFISDDRLQAQRWRRSPLCAPPHPPPPSPPPLSTAPGSPSP